MTSPVDDPWAGKVLLIYTAFAGPSSGAGVAIQDAHTEHHFARPFLVGRVPHSERDWAAGLQVAVAWDQVAHCLVFDSLQQYESCVAQAPLAWDSRPSN